MTKKKPAKQTNSGDEGTITIVGIGASAGGLEALRDLMGTLPVSDDLCYVITQHVSPTHVSMLMGLLAPLTKLSVSDLIDAQEPVAGKVFITPPNHDVIFKEGTFRLVEPHLIVGPKPSVNRFFESLAQACPEQSIGVILSGTGSDGASGMRALKAAGGITIAQEPDTAKYDGMPKSAIHTGSVDLILSAKEIGMALERLIHLHSDTPLMQLEDSGKDEFTKIMSWVRSVTCFKLNDYKEATVKRRVVRRMNIVGVDSLSGYIDYLKEHRDEAHMLMRDTFIGVTSFFRDPDVFVELETVLLEIIGNADESKVIRIWIPGCSTGEEAYSIAMLMENAIRNLERDNQQYVIFASDMDDESLDHARAGLYAITEINNIPKSLRDQYTDSIGDHFSIAKDLRSRIVFTRQNVIEDPPFGRLDLVSCRNLLIYLKAEVQKRVMEVFHYALNKGGRLLLGKSESVEQHAHLFSTSSRRSRIFSRMDGVGHYNLPVARGFSMAAEVKKSDTATAAANSSDSLHLRVLEELAERYVPPSLVIDADDHIVHFQGDLKPYLHFPKGRAEMNFFELVDASIRVDLRALVFSCRRDNKIATGPIRKIDINGAPHIVTPIVVPLEENARCALLITFEAQAVETDNSAVIVANSSERESLIVSELEQELANARAHLNVVVEELETSNEELQSLNEELQSANEELQSTNEELQTSNEELQSTNEELLTVNEELQTKSAELEISASDLNNVKESLSFPVLVVDKGLRITQVNRACETIIHQDGLMEGCSLNSIQWQLELPGLAAKVRKVIQSGHTETQDVSSDDLLHYYLQIMPYKIRHEEIAGALLLFEDITEKYLAEQALKQNEKRLRLMFTGIKDYAVIFLDTQGYIAEWNEGARRIKGYQHEDIVGRHLSIFYTQQDRQNSLPQHLLDEAKANGRAINKGWRVRKDGSLFYADVVLAAVYSEENLLVGFTKITLDITKQREAEEALKASEQRFRQVTESLPQLVWTCTPDGPCDYLNPQWVQYTGIPEEEQLGYGWLDQLHPDDRQRTIEHWQKTAAKGNSFAIEFRIRRSDGEYRWFHTLAVPLRNAAGEITKWFGSNTDIDEIKQSHAALKASETRIKRVIDIMPESILVVGHDGVIADMNERCLEIFGYSKQELLQQPIECLLPQRYRQSHINRRQQYARSPSFRPMGAGRDLHALHKNGEEFPVEIALAPYDDGNSRFTVVSIADITDRKLLEDELRLAANVFANTLDGIVILDPEQNIIKVNRAFEHIIGYQQDEIVGQSIRVLRSQHHDSNFYKNLWFEVRTKGKWQGEIWERHHDGHVVPVWLTISTLYSAAGQVDRYICTLYDISEQKTNQERINYLAHYDVLTELPNRTLFMDRFEHALTQAKRNGTQLAVLFVDLDNFKQVNDTHGHPIGDALLCEVAKRLKAATRQSDTVGRLSGDEFLVLLEDTTNNTNVRKTAEKILNQLNQPANVGKGDFIISASIGIACYPDDAKDANSLLKHADLAMYKAKETGRNQFHFYNQAMSESIEERMALQSDLLKALEKNELELHFQPVIDVNSERCVGAEALIRWNHPVRGWILPIKFIALAEENSLIVPLGEWVLREACRQLADWGHYAQQLQFLAVNVSGKQLMQGDFVNVAKDIIQQSGCPAERITLELTESFIMHQSETAIGHLQKLRDLGIGIAIDDFGTGYSSLSYLKRLPVTKLKLDRSFVQDIPNDANDVAIARAILKLGEAVGLDVVAEGVETREQHSFLINEGCLLSQGYLYAKPMPAKEFTQYLATLMH